MKKLLLTCLLIINLVTVSPLISDGFIVHAEDATPSAQVADQNSMVVPTEQPVPTLPPKPTEPPKPTPPTYLVVVPVAPTPLPKPVAPTAAEYFGSSANATANGQQTGGQSGSYASGNSSVVTGDANATDTIVTNANNNTAGSGSGTSNGGSADVTNSQNGFGSSNNGLSTTNDTSDTNLTNNAAVQNGLVEVAGSGNNSNSYNTGNGSIQTGNANVSGTVLNGINTNAFGSAEFTVTGEHVGNIVLVTPDSTGTCTATCVPLSLSASNSGNGAASDNNASASATQNSTSNLTNNATLTSDITLTGVSGDNTADYNNGTGSISTGDVNAAANVLNAVNSNITSGGLYVINVVGNLIGDIVLPDITGSGSSCNTCTAANSSATNSGNGTGSQNNASTSSNNTNTTNMVNNADVNNAITVNGNTGDNTTGYNTNGDNTTQTGSVNLSANAVNVANVNANDASSNQPIWIVLVNKVGNWAGQILGGTPGDTMGATDGIQFSPNADGSVTASNTNNGAYSQNNANSGANNNTTTNMSNTATINNNVTINGDTGHNDASYNVNGASIITGDVNAAVNIINFVNNNFAGRPVYVAVINVFGNWIGNVVNHANGGTNNTQQHTAQPAVGGTTIQDPTATATPGPVVSTTTTSSTGSGPSNTNNFSHAQSTAFSSTDGNQSSATNNIGTGLVAGAHITISKNNEQNTLGILWPILALAIVCPVFSIFAVRRVTARRKLHRR